MNRRQLAVALALVAIVVAALVVLLLTGGGQRSRPAASVKDAQADVVIGQGADPPKHPERADITGADVRRDGAGLVFDATLGAAPSGLRGGSLDLHWRIFEGGQNTWTLTVSLDVGPTVTLLSHKSNFGVSSLDEEFPGSIEVAGRRVTVTLRPDDIDPTLESFPKTFSWQAKSRLDGVQGDPKSAVAEDAVPNSGFGEVEE